MEKHKKSVIRGKNNSSEQDGFRIKKSTFRVELRETGRRLIESIPYNREKTVQDLGDGVSLVEQEHGEIVVQGITHRIESVAPKNEDGGKVSRPRRLGAGKKSK